MIKKVWLEPKRMERREIMGPYMQEVFCIESEIRGLDALNDLLSEVTNDIRVYLSRQNTETLSKSRYGYKVLSVIAEAAEDNPHITLHFREKAPMEAAE